MKLKLQDMLWRSGFKSLLIGFLLLSVSIFSFFSIEMHDLYTQMENYAKRVTIISGDFIKEKRISLNNTLTQIQPEIINVMQQYNILAKYIITDITDVDTANKIRIELQTSLNKLLHAAGTKHKLYGLCIFDKTGTIIAKYGMQKYTYVSSNVIQKLPQNNRYKPIFGISDSGINSIIQLPVDFECYLMIFQKTNLQVFKQFVQFNKFYKIASKIKLYISLLLLTVFLILIGIFLFYSLHVVRRVSKKILNNLQQLMYIATQVNEQNNIDQIPEVEIQEFQDIINILLTNLNNIKSFTKQIALINMNLNEKNTVIKEIIDNISSGIFLFSVDLNIILVNAQAQKLLNIDTTQKKIDIEKIFPEAIEIIHETIKKHTYTERQIDRKIHRFLVRCSIQNNKILLAFEDISHQISLQKQAAWRDVARVIAHEVKNPLTPTKLCAEQMLYDNELSKEKRDKYLNVIIKNVNHVNKLIDDFTNFAKHTQQLPDIISFDLTALVNEILTVQQLVYKKIHMHNNILKTFIIEADRKQIEQALTNLILNAAQAFDSTINNPEIKISYEKTNGMCNISVDDNGMGIKVDKIDKLFQPYMTTKSYGTGLGLVIVKKIAQTHGGTVQLSPKQQGVTAILSIRTL